MEHNKKIKNKKITLLLKKSLSFRNSVCVCVLGAVNGQDGYLDPGFLCLCQVYLKPFLSM